ncbi:hypothetical protein KI809_19135 [Geobacter pelophilus]|uniref:Uncharacterized protein n=1 Tax=Geoanaerobacter pelophilus TaxID=60036 RepID=A0AAW4LBF2_9BACT|nr:hypothetical protein [Geoanaerobacter pelophilus]MBT0666428.1 hypothetical protein [Geoanaerobacter pelophilus]
MPCLFCYPNRLDDSLSYSTTLSGGSWSATLPLTNLKSPLLSKKARSTNALAASTQFNTDMGTPRAIRALALLRHNLSSAATVRFRGYSDSGYTSLVWDSTALSVWPEGYPAVENKKRYQEDFYVILTAAATARYWKTEIVDTANSAGYIEIGRAFYAPAFEPGLNMSYGASISLETDTTSERSKGGVDYYDRSEPRRVIQFTLPVNSQDQAFSDIFDMQWDRGIDQPLLFVFEPTDTGVLLKKRSWLATLRRLSAIEFPYVNNHSVAFELMETL